MKKVQHKLNTKSNNDYRKITKIHYNGQEYITLNVMYGLAEHEKPRLTRLAQWFQDNLIGLNNPQTHGQNIPNLSSS